MSTSGPPTEPSQPSPASFSSPPPGPAPVRSGQRRGGGGLTIAGILIIAGVLILLGNFGLWSWTEWADVWKFWPVLLILWGLFIIFGRYLGAARWAVRAALIVLVIIFIVSGVGAAPGMDWGDWRWSGWNWGPGINASGTLVTRDIDAANFQEIFIEGPFDVVVKSADGWKTTLTADDNIIDHLNVTSDGNTLRIRTDGTSLHGRPTLRVNVEMPDLRRMSASGVATVQIDGFKSNNDLEIRVSGASSATGNAEVGRARLEASGASKITLEGTAKSAEIEVSGASSVRAERLVAGEARVEVSGASRAEVNVTGRLEPHVSGASTLIYDGNPTLTNVENSGASTIRKR